MAAEQKKKDEKEEERKKKEPPPPPPPPHIAAFNELKIAVGQLEKAVATKEVRFVARALRQIAKIRRKMDARTLNNALESFFPLDSEVKAALLAQVAKAPVTDQEMQDAPPAAPAPAPAAAAASAPTTDAAAPAAASESGAPTAPPAEEKITPPKTVSPEVEVFVWLLVTMFLLDRKLYQDTIESSTNLLDRIESHGKRSLDPIAAKTYFFYARAYELTNRLPEIRNKLLAAHRTASLRHDHTGQAVLLNLLLRNYLAFNLYEQADALVRKTTFPEEHASNNEHARYLYYTGRIKAVQLDYSDSYNCLEHAIRKAPTSTGKGFRLAVHKLGVIVKLLTGEIPERTLFFQKGMVQQLAPYLQLTQAVRVGNLDMFKTVMATHSKQFQEDKTYTLIVRLRQNVIKTGLRKIHLTYSNISLKEVCQKLQLDCVEDAEYIVAKAIHDGVIDATIDHVNGTLSSKSSLDVYTTDEPQTQFHKRISFCLDMHNQAVRAMRFPPQTHKKINETPEERLARIQQEEDDIASGLDDDFY